MKKTILILFVTFMTFQLNAQENKSEKSVYKCNIQMSVSPYKMKGVLYQVKDSGIIFLKPATKKQPNYDTLFIPVEQIINIYLKKKGNGGKGILYGGLVGAFIGGLLGYAGGDDPEEIILSTSAESKAVAGVIVGFIPGGLIGLAIGSVKTVIPIHGEMKFYQSNRWLLNSCSILK